MGAVLLLVLVLHAGDADGLAAAREAFARGDYATAETLALGAAQPPREGEALYLAGLARFRSGRPAQALEALDEAGRAADAPARAEWQFNRGACLYQLDRFSEAEDAFRAAADGSSTLAPLALANAGFAAIDAGAVDRAADLARRGRALGDASTRSLLDDLEADVARHRGRAQVAAAGDALARGDRVLARQLARTALATPLEPDEAARARGVLDAATPGLAGRGTGWDLMLRAGAAYDSNVLQSGLRSGQELVPIAGGPVDSLALLASGAVSYRSRLGPRVALEAAYAVDEVAYLASAAEDYGLQQHALGLGVEWSLTDALRFGAGGGGQWTFTGLSSFRSLQGAIGGSGWAALDETDATTTRLELGFTRKAAASPEFAYLTGNRIDLALTQQLRLRSDAIELGYRYRDERIGTATLSTTATARTPGCGMIACPAEYTEPFGYGSHALLAAARWQAGPRLSLAGLVGFEWRTYGEDTVLRVTGTSTMMSAGTSIETYRQRREDQRFLASASGTLRLTRWLSLAGRYDLVVNASTIRTTFEDRNYTKHLVSIEGIAQF